MSDELEAIRQRRLEELQQQMSFQQSEALKQQAQLQKQIAVLETVAKQAMSKEAVIRYGNLKAAHPEKALQLIAIIAQAIQQGQLNEQITDEKLKNLLIQLEPPKKEFKMTKK
ncbi:hypothetical protein FJZ53_02840 [Candidatus Woesearchaeota archaeon]|nr:hypothetical protein [Candidatus Woesearchaeota archaeon]